MTAASKYGSSGGIANAIVAGLTARSIDAVLLAPADCDAGEITESLRDPAVIAHHETR